MQLSSDCQIQCYVASKRLASPNTTNDAISANQDVLLLLFRNPLFGKSHGPRPLQNE